MWRRAANKPETHTEPLVQVVARLPWWIWPLVAYAVGSTPVGWMVGRSRGVDLRCVGSGNIGATNVWRTLGRRWGAFTFLMDFIKGALPVWAADVGAVERPWLPALCGLLAVMGHVFPAALGFRGGKGVATGAGVLTAMAPLAAVAALIAWSTCFFAFRYVSLASLVAALTAGGIGYFHEGYAGWTRRVLLSLAVLIVIRHRRNIIRLLRGEEPRVKPKTPPKETTLVCPP